MTMVRGIATERDRHRERRRQKTQKLGIVQKEFETKTERKRKIIQKTKTFADDSMVAYGRVIFIEFAN